jgi:hypothetical protein
MMPGFSRFRFTILPAVAAFAAVLSGCNDSPRAFNCPGSAILADAATRPVLKPGAAATDPAALLFTVHAVTIDTDCVLDRRAGETDSNITLAFRATRAPNGQAAHYVVPYFLAINQGERVINKRLFNMEIDFAPGASTVTVETAIRRTVLRLENGHLPTDYQFLAGFQLSDTEQAYLKSVGPYTP